MWNNSRPRCRTPRRNNWRRGRATPKLCWRRPSPPSKRRPRAERQCARPVQVVRPKKACYTYTPPYDTASTRPAASSGWPWPWSQRVTQGRTRGLWGESKATHRRGDVSSSSMVGTVAPIDGATPVLVGGCHRVMRPEEVAHLVHRVGNQVLGLLPGRCFLRPLARGAPPPFPSAPALIVSALDPAHHSTLSIDHLIEVCAYSLPLPATQGRAQRLWPQA